MTAFILNNKLASFLIVLLLASLIYISVLKIESWSQERDIATLEKTVSEQAQTLKRITNTNHENNATINELQKDISICHNQLETASRRHSAAIMTYKQLLKECQEKFSEENSATITIVDCKLKIVDSNSTTIKLLNTIGQ